MNFFFSSSLQCKICNIHKHKRIPPKCTCVRTVGVRRGLLGDLHGRLINWLSDDGGGARGSVGRWRAPLTTTIILITTGPFIVSAENINDIIITIGYCYYYLYCDYCLTAGASRRIVDGRAADGGRDALHGAARREDGKRTAAAEGQGRSSAAGCAELPCSTSFVQQVRVRNTGSNRPGHWFGTGWAPPIRRGGEDVAKDF